MAGRHNNDSAAISPVEEEHERAMSTVDCATIAETRNKQEEEEEKEREKFDTRYI